MAWKSHFMMKCSSSSIFWKWQYLQILPVAGIGGLNWQPVSIPNLKELTLTCDIACLYFGTVTKLWYGSMLRFTLNLIYVWSTGYFSVSSTLFSHSSLYHQTVANLKARLSESISIPLDGIFCNSDIFPLPIDFIKLATLVHQITSGFPLQSASDMEIVSMTWHCHDGVT